MFNEDEDWNDEEEGQVLSKPALSNTKKASSGINVPLNDASVDLAVFCLSLMGTNLADFLAEANRVLKKRGVLKIAEVASRFDNVRNFITALSSLGFKMVSKDTENSHFYSFEFAKTGKAPENLKKVGLQLKPCVYKKR
uniref:Ribosomal RNA-processing protein 8 n=1 Tax=Neolamprologus brichardi TaxID=32507 RepID=A0A3Q4IFH9_NEOBR